MKVKKKLATLRERARLGERAHATLQHRRTWVILTLLAVLVAISTPFWAAHHLADTVSVTVTFTGQPVTNKDGTPLTNKDGTPVINTDGTPLTNTVSSQNPYIGIIIQGEYFNRVANGATAREVQSLLNDTRVITPFSGFGCDGQFSSTIEYDFHFSFLGIPVQEARMKTGICNPLQLTTLGVMSPLHHYPPDHGAWQRIEQLLSIPDPSVWYAK